MLIRVIWRGGSFEYQVHAQVTIFRSPVPYFAAGSAGQGELAITSSRSNPSVADLPGRSGLINSKVSWGV